MLKKAIALPLLAGLALPALADDAKVLPERVLRTTVLPSFTTIDEAFDSDGEKQDISQVSVDTVSIALEYGINDWITAGLQWAPGYAWSGEVEGNDNIDLSGANDLFVGAKFQFLGANGYSQNDSMRFAVTPGMKLPISRYDAQEEVDNAMAGDDFKPGRTDRGAWGFGARFAFDYLVTPDFYINVYNQTSFFLETNQDYGVAFTPAPTAVEDADVKYGAELIFEVEPHYSTMVGYGVQLSMGLPLRYTTTGETEVNGNVADEDKWKFEFMPKVGVFFRESPLPVELILSYSTALAGENENAANTVALRIRNFVRF